MQLDILLISAPNKNIDYPSLALPSLAGAIHDNGLSSKIIDLNIEIRDKIITKIGLYDLINNVIPLLLCMSKNNILYLHRLRSAYDFLISLENQFGFSYIEETKNLAQKRLYENIFNDEKRFKSYLHIFQINRTLHNIIEASIIKFELLDSTFLHTIIKNELDNLKNIIIQNNVKIIGFSILDIQRAFSYFLIKEIKKYYNGFIVVGGSDPTRFPEEYLKYFQEIDIVFWREADISLPIFIRNIKYSANVIEITPSIYYRDSLNNIQFSSTNDICFDDLSTPIFNDLPLNKYLTPIFPIQTSRGCYWKKCKFCIHYDTYNQFIKRSPQKVLDDIKKIILLHDAKYFHFTDDALPISMAKELFENLSTLNIKWLSYIRFENQFTDEIIKLQKLAGASVIEAGLESASEKVLKLMNKNINLDTVQRIIDNASANNILVKLFMFYGYPGETIDDLKLSLNFIEANILNKKIRPFLTIRNRFELLKGSTIYNEVTANRNKYIKKVWLPSGIFSIRAEYLISHDNNEIEEMLATFLEKMDSYINENNIYSTNDENITLDLITRDYDYKSKYASI